MKKTVIIGASNNPSRYSYLAAQLLKEYGHEFIPVGIKKGEVFGYPILSIHDKPLVEEVDTVTLYVSPRNQEGLADYLLSLKPKRVIFNPGTENKSLEDFLEQKNIEVVEACTLVMLRTSQY